MLYLFFKWLHIVSVISWMAGVLYLYRLLVNLAERGDHPEIHALLCVMAKRLYRYITMPAMGMTYIAGFGMIGLQPALSATGWFGTKFLLVLLMTAATIMAGRLTRRFAEKAPNLPSAKRLRILNEIPTLLLLIIVALVVFKPF